MRAMKGKGGKVPEWRGLHKAVNDSDLEGLKKMLENTYESTSATVRRLTNQLLHPISDPNPLQVDFDKQDINETAFNNSVGLGMTALQLAAREGLLDYVM